MVWYGKEAYSKLLSTLDSIEQRKILAWSSLVFSSDNARKISHSTSGENSYNELMDMFCVNLSVHVYIAQAEKILDRERNETRDFLS